MGSNLVSATMGAAVAAIIAIVGIFIARHVTSRRLRGCIDLLRRRMPAPVNPADIGGEDNDFDALDRAVTNAARQVQDIIDSLKLDLARQQTILSSMGEGVVVLDKRMRVLFCNEAMARAVRARQPFQSKQPLLELVRDSDLHTLIEGVIASGEQAKRSLKIGAANGRSFEVYATPFEDGTGRGAIAIFHDITDLERLEQVRKDFIANVSHEMRTPLASIVACADTLLEGALEEAQNNRRFVEIVKANASRLNSISADLLILSDLESGVKPGQTERISVRDALDTAIRTVEAEAATSAVRLKTGAIADEFVVGHKFRLEQALMNLLANAVKFNRPGGEVRATVSKGDDGCVRIAISDTGIGIPSQDWPRIFERFYRVDKARSRKVGGTGLGLSIVKHVIEGMNGSVEVESQLGRGSTFTITLPAANGQCSVTKS